MTGAAREDGWLKAALDQTNPDNWTHDKLRAEYAALKHRLAEVERALLESRAETEAMRLNKEAQVEANLNGAKKLAEVVADHAALVRLVEEYVDARDERIARQRLFTMREHYAWVALATWRRGRPTREAT